MKKLLMTAACLMMANSASALEPLYYFSEISDDHGMAIAKIMTTYTHERQVVKAEQPRKALQNSAETSEQAHVKKAIQQRKDMDREEKNGGTEAVVSSEQMHSRAAMNREAIRLTGKSAVQPQVSAPQAQNGSSGAH